MSEIIKTNENINSIALAYYDEEDEVLKEVNEDNLYFSLSPYSTKYKRLYLIGDLIYRDIIKVEAFVNSFGEITNYEVKLNLLDAFNNISDFSDSTNRVYCTLNNTHLNSIPLDILVISTNTSYETVNLEIRITVGESDAT